MVKNILWQWLAFDYFFKPAVTFYKGQCAILQYHSNLFNQIKTLIRMFYPNRFAKAFTSTTHIQSPIIKVFSQERTPNFTRLQSRHGRRVVLQEMSYNVLHSRRDILQSYILSGGNVVLSEVHRYYVMFIISLHFG